MSVTFANKLRQIPGYQAGVPKGKSAEAVAASDLIQLASNESPIPPHPAVVEAIKAAAAAMNRYPDPEATVLRRRLADRYDLDPARIAVSNGSCEILLAAAEALCEPGSEILYAWPAFSMYPMLAPLTGAREIRVPLDDSDTHDLEAMLAEITAATQLVLICNPNNPTGTYLPAERIADFCARAPDHVTIICDEAYIEFSREPSLAQRAADRKDISSPTVELMHKLETTDFEEVLRSIDSTIVTLRALGHSEHSATIARLADIAAEMFAEFFEPGEDAGATVSARPCKGGMPDAQAQPFKQDGHALVGAGGQEAGEHRISGVECNADRYCFAVADMVAGNRFADNTSGGFSYDNTRSDQYGSGRITGNTFWRNGGDTDERVIFASDATRAEHQRRTAERKAHADGVQQQILAIERAYRD